MALSITLVTKAAPYMTGNVDCELRIFDQIVYFGSGFIDDEVLSILKSSFAESTCFLSDSVTHCIVGNNYIAADVHAARELYDITTITPDWIRMSALCNKLLPTKPFDPLEDNLFSGILVSVSQLTANDCKTLWALVTYNGGNFSLTLDLNNTTHLVVTKPIGKKYDAVFLNSSNKIKIVTPDWIIDCLKNKKLCSEISYHPRLLVSPKLLPTEVKTKGLSTISGLSESDAPAKQPRPSATTNQGFKLLNLRLPWNQTSIFPLPTPYIQTPSPQVPQVPQVSLTTVQSMKSFGSTSKLQRLSQQQVQELKIQQETLVKKNPSSSLPAKKNQFQQQQNRQTKIQNMPKNYILNQLGPQNQTRKQMKPKSQKQNTQLKKNQQNVQQLESKQQPIQMPQLQQKKVQNQLPHLQQQRIKNPPSQSSQLQQKTVPTQQGQQQQKVQIPQLQQQSVSTQQGQQQQKVQIPQLQQQSVPTRQGQQQQKVQIPQLQQQSVSTRQGQQQQKVQIPQLQQQSVPTRQGQQQQKVQIPQLQQQTVNFKKDQIQPGQTSQLQKYLLYPNQVDQESQTQPQQFQTGNSHQVQLPTQQATQNTQVHIQKQQVTQNTQVHIQQQQQQHQPNLSIQEQQPLQPNPSNQQQQQLKLNPSNQQPLQPNSPDQQTQPLQPNPSNQQQQSLQPNPSNQQQLMSQQHFVQQNHETTTTQWKTTHSSSNMSNSQVKQQKCQQVHHQTLVIEQQQAVNMNSANMEKKTQALDQRQLVWSQQGPNGSQTQQTINMDANTHHQIQMMKPAQRLALINNLNKQRNAFLQQQNASQEHLTEGVLGSKNIIRPSIPSGQTTEMQNLNHQQKSSVTIQAQQAQWIQIRHQQSLVHQQQQQKRQMVDGTVTTNVETTNVKTVCNTLVNSRQVPQPNITILESSVVNNLEFHQISKSRFAAQVEKSNQTYEQSERDKQKQQSIMKHVVTNPPVTPVIQKHIVQPPQLGTAQISIVQLQQPPISLTNEHTETQIPSQESFAKTPGQEIKDAEQTNLMIAKDHAAQQQSTNQSGTALNNVNTHLLLPANHDQSTNHATQQQSTNQSGTAINNVNTDYLLLPANSDQSTIEKVAEILEKSAALQPTNQQRLAHQYKYLGHSPNINVPSNKCLLGCIFLIVEYDQCPDTRKELTTWKKIIIDHGGEVDPFYTSRLTHIICKSQMHPCVTQGLFDGKRCITAYWLSDVIIKQKLLPPWYALHLPTLYSEEKPCSHMIMSLTNFEGEERNRVKFMIELTGAKVTSYFSDDNDILVSRVLEGKKVKKAQDIMRPIVNVQWLNKILFGYLSCIYEPENSTYQQFNLDNPFKVDYSLVVHLMNAWKVPIDVDLDIYDRVCNNPIPIQRKRTKSSSDFIDQENDDLNTSDIIVINIDPPPIEHRPCIMLSGFGLGKEEHRMVLQLGGTIAKTYSDATHLVMKEPARTTKFLCCISTVKYIVTDEWLKDSSTIHMFLGEANYTVKELSVDQKVTCNVPKVLSNPNRHELFKGKIFYITPGVTHPSKLVVQQIIESAGGTVDKQRRSLRSIREFEPNTYIVIATNNDLHLVADLIESSVGIYCSEFVLSAVMTQSIDYNMIY